jgi:hypothetical protein
MSLPREILIETIQIGSILRVTAVDAVTGLEVMFQAPLSAGRESLQRLAADKLRYVQKKTNQ